MNTNVSIDVDMLDRVPAKTMLKLLQMAQDAKKYSGRHQITVQHFTPLFRFFEERDIEPQFNLQDGDINVYFTGDGDRLAEVWRELRRNGWNTESRPQKGDSSYYGRWKCEGAEFSNIWLSFSSTVCKRVKVGTRMVEQDIYETQCGEVPTIEQIETPKLEQL